VTEKKWVTLKSYSTPIEAQVARTKLESEEIECFIRDEHTLTINWLYSNAMGGVRLCVLEPDLERARMSLAEGDAVSLQSCPECGGSDFSEEPARGHWWAYPLVLFNFPVPFRPGRRRCGKCGARWRA
jgi:hypothetical protein